MLVGFIILCALSGAFHYIDEGHIGVYYRGGALLSEVSEPGLHYAIPIITKVHNV